MTHVVRGVCVRRHVGREQPFSAHGGQAQPVAPFGLGVIEQGVGLGQQLGQRGSGTGCPQHHASTDGQAAGGGGLVGNGQVLHRLAKALQLRRQAQGVTNADKGKFLTTVARSQLAGALGVFLTRNAKLIDSADQL